MTPNQALLALPKEELVHQIRHLQWKNKLMGRQLGRQGDVIYTLRCQLAELREMVTKHSRGEFRRLQQAHDNLLAENTRLHEELSEWKESERHATGIGGPAEPVEVTYGLLQSPGQQ